jgi:alanyl-tRNA synthetase
VVAAVKELVASKKDLQKQSIGSTHVPLEKRLAEIRQTSAGKASDGDKKETLDKAARILSVAPMAVAERAAALRDEVIALERQLSERAAAGPLSGDRLLEQAEKMGEVTVIVAEVPPIEPNVMRQLIDQVRGKTRSSAVLLASRAGGDKVTLVAGISKDLQARKLSAGEWIRPVAEVVGGGGGGRPDMAQAGGKNPAKLPEAMQVANDTLRKLLQSLG